MHFSNLTIRVRFAILIGIFVLGSALYGSRSILVFNELKVNGPLYHRIVQSKDLIADILPPPEYIIESFLVSVQLAGAPDKEEQERLIARLARLRTDYLARHDYWANSHLEPELEAALLEQAHQPALAFYALAFDDFIPAVRAQDKAAAAASMLKMREAYQAHRTAIDNVVQMSTKRADADESEAAQRIAAGTWHLLLILACSLGAGVAVALMIARGITQPLQGAVQIAQIVASGDLSADIAVQRGDETGQLMLALKEMNGALVRIVGEVRGGAEAINEASNQIASGNRDLSARTSEQASSLAATASAMEQLTATVKHNADNARAADALALAASDVAVKGGAVVAQVVDTMSAINSASNKVVDIIGVIDAIAFQTNILALNAAVEAARAGEQGRGFAVVAAEVRNLAQRSAAAAKEIKTLIDDSVEQVERGASLVVHAGSTMEQLVTRVDKVTALIGAIARASEEQTGGIEDISRAIEQMDEVTQQNAALVEEAAAAAESMCHQTEKLSRLVSVFKLSADK